MSVHEFADLRHVVTATLTTSSGAGAYLSPIVDLGGAHLAGIQMPSSWTAAQLTFAVSEDGTTGTQLELYTDTGGPVQITTTGGRFVRLDPTAWRGIRYLRVRSGPASSGIPQSTGRTIGLVVTPRG
jgi:hypothetical protein